MTETMTQEKLTSADMVRAAGCTYRQLHYWTQSGHLRPCGSQNDGKGSGYARFYAPEELAIARRMAQLTADGMMPPEAADVARNGEPVIWRDKTYWCGTLPRGTQVLVEEPQS